VAGADSIDACHGTMRGVNSTGGNRHEFHGPAQGAGDIETGPGGLCGRGRTVQQPGRAGDLSGFLGQFVGFVVGFLGLPDTHLISVINDLEANCRVCRVFLGVESSGEFRANKKPPKTHRPQAKRRASSFGLQLDSKTPPQDGLLSVTL
jgi:hypothetical protein